MDLDFQHVFYPSDTEVWEVGEVLSGNLDANEVTIKGGTKYGGQTTTLRLDECQIISSLQDMNALPSDLIKLSDVHRPGILYTLHRRFMKDQIYTSIGPVLVAFNPFKWITGLYDDELLDRYSENKSDPKGYDLSSRPHVFAMSEDAMVGLRSGLDQSLIISGESGAGKTEATKQCLFYLATQASKMMAAREAAEDEEKGKEGLPGAPPPPPMPQKVDVHSARAHKGAKDKPGQQGQGGGGGSSSMFNPESQTGIQARILQASPILEAWGNAKTLRNNNSSRFGKFIEIWFGEGQKAITKSVNTTYLLEKTRVISQEHNERNYHVFYQLLKGGGADLLDKLYLTDIAKSPLSARFLHKSGVHKIDGVDDLVEFR